MSLRLSNFILLHLTTRWPLLIYATAWTTLLTATVALASFSPEVAFVSSISPSSSFSRKCTAEGFFRVPLALPGDILCLPAHLFVKSKIDLVVPPVFAAVIVAASACVVRAMGLWEDDNVR
ncbi:Forkhead box protein G [Quillaja saponaria]|uniref:Forkhead box protein G n=1 Tax=Quillaja saponaria TaxID=32244 RepID=A0AAD7Q8Z6_QUISA|nr:Forkhead box protein G [Quillaja saponaria]